MRGIFILVLLISTSAFAKVVNRFEFSYETERDQCTQIASDVQANLDAFVASHDLIPAAFNLSYYISRGTNADSEPSDTWCNILLISKSASWGFEGTASSKKFGRDHAQTCAMIAATAEADLNSIFVATVNGWLVLPFCEVDSVAIRQFN